MKGAKNRAEFLKKTLFTSSLARQRVHPGPGCGYCRLGDANIHPIVGRKRVVFAKEPEHALNLCRLDEASRRNFLQLFRDKILAFRHRQTLFSVRRNGVPDTCSSLNG